MQTRIEKDSMGEMQVPDSALYGAQTHRAVLNFPISGYRFGRRLPAPLQFTHRRTVLQIRLANSVPRERTARTRRPLRPAHDY